MARPLRELIGVGLALFCAACGGHAGAAQRETLVFWAFGREGEVVKGLVSDFERENPSLHLVVQQIPWTSAHEKLLTAFVGRSTPDLAQLGNTWIPELAAIGALERLDDRVAASTAVAPAAYFSGVWQTNLFEGALYGVPWYVDTRVLFYRPDLLARAGFPEPPRDWESWREAMRKIKALQDPAAHPILLPTNEWEQATILGLQEGSTLLSPDGARGVFHEPAFAAAARFYADLFREDLAPMVSYTQIGNVYQEFARGNLAFWMTGPWNLGEFRHRLTPSEQDLWMTMPLPAPRLADWPGTSFAGGSSLAVFRGTRSKEQAWKVIEFLSQPRIQARFYALSGDLPARTAAWEDPALSGDRKARAFREQLEHVTPMPRVPEWEQIAQKVVEDLEPAVRGRESVSKGLARLDADVDRILEKRRWMLSRKR
jgi:multiple sugar transport system substrate-binding protein